MTTELALFIMILLLTGAAVALGIVGYLFLKFIVDVIDEMGKF